METVAQMALGGTDGCYVTVWEEELLVVGEEVDPGEGTVASGAPSATLEEENRAGGISEINVRSGSPGSPVGGDVALPT